MKMMTARSTHILKRQRRNRTGEAASENSFRNHPLFALDEDHIIATVILQARIVRDGKLEKMERTSGLSGSLDPT
jgi:hypothetical protein